MHAGNVYGVLPKTRARDASIIMMLMHQLVAFCLYSASLYYMQAFQLTTGTACLCHDCIQMNILPRALATAPDAYQQSVVVVLVDML